MRQGETQEQSQMNVMSLLCRQKLLPTQTVRQTYHSRVSWSHRKSKRVHQAPGIAMATCSRHFALLAGDSKETENKGEGRKNKEQGGGGVFTNLQEGEKHSIIIISVNFLLLIFKCHFQREVLWSTSSSHC